MTRRYLPLVALMLVIAGCDFKETRSGQIVLTPAGAAGIPLNGKAGAATLVAGPATLTFKKGSSDKAIALLVKQNGRADVNLEATVAGDYTSGNFTLRGSEIGQPVDMTSARSFAITAPNQRDSRWEDQGNQTCLVEYTYDLCDEAWSLTFKAVNGVELGSFSSKVATRCNEQRGFPTFCRRDPSREPHIPDFPRGPHRSQILNDAQNGVSFE